MNQQWDVDDIIQHLGYGYPSGLNYYITTRHLREEATKLKRNAQSL
jgi:hypothetical protein